ncbi:MAG: nuclear transport factor 2 family protein [Gemmatimonadales bacterium]|nr:nuclear transport factor 2 family protein [Gemmatimonadales bacterium]
MSEIFRRLLLPSALTCAAFAAPLSAQTEDARAAVVVVERMFDALARGDTAGMRATFVPEGRVVQTGTREGQPFYRVNSIDDFLRSIGSAAGRKLEEKIFEVESRVEDNLAVVWSRYDFFVNGAKSHCGVDSYQLVRVGAEWKLLHIVDTQQRPCPTP